MTRSIQVSARPPWPLRAAVGLLLISTAGLVLPARTVWAADTCTSSEAANALLRCEHCKAVKQLLGDVSIADVTIEVHDLQHGAVVKLAGHGPESIELVHSLVEEMWSPGRHCKTAISEACHQRFDTLGRVGIDRALTDDGVILVLSCEDDELARWVREDARMTRSFVLSAASAH